MNASISFPAAILFTLLSCSVAFQTFPHRFIVPHRAFTVPSRTSLRSTIDDYAIFASAESCILDDECSVEQAENLMSDVLSIQASCVASTSPSPICGEALLTSELIVGLRGKIKREIEGNTFIGKTAADFEELAQYTFQDASGTIDPMSVLAPLRIEYIGSLIFLALLIHEQVANPQLEPFTMQEWGWGIRDGYAMDMIGHHMGLGF